MGLFDAEGQSHNTVYALHRFMLGIYCMTVSRSCKGKRVLPNPWHKRLRHIINLRKRRGYYYASLAKRLTKQGFWAPVSYASVNSSCAQPSLPPGYCGAVANFVLPGSPSICQPWGPFPSFWYARGFLKYNYAEDFTRKERRFAHLSRTWINGRGL